MSTVKTILQINLFSLILAMGIFAIPEPAQALDRRLPQSTALTIELEEVRSSLQSSISRLGRLQAAAKRGRSKVEQLEDMVKQIDQLDDRVARIIRELKSLSKIPQLKMLKPMVRALESIKSSIGSVRKQADKIRRDVLKPIIAKIKKFERKVSDASTKLRGVDAQTASAQRQVKEWVSFVAQRGYKRYQVSALEGISRSTRGALQPIERALVEVDRAGADAERQLNSYANSIRIASNLKPALDKLERDMAPFDKKARDIGKVMGKRLSLKLPFKTISFTVREVLESPDKIVKPLLQPVNKLLQPLLKKVNINIKAPKELTQLVNQLNAMKGKMIDLSQAERRLDNATKSNSIHHYQASLKQLLSTKLPR